MKKKIELEDALEMIVQADAVAIDGIPAAIAHYIGDEDSEVWKENPEDYSGNLVEFSYSGFSFLEEAALTGSHHVEIAPDRSCLIVLDSLERQEFLIGLFQSVKIPEIENKDACDA